MFWKNDRNKYGSITREKVQLYECQFTHLPPDTSSGDSVKPWKINGRCLVVCNTVEEAIAACREQWPNEFVLHGVHKRNHSSDLIVVNAVFDVAEPGIQPND